jgi:hypothetical protein
MASILAGCLCPVATAVLILLSLSETTAPTANRFVVSHTDYHGLAIWSYRERLVYVESSNSVIVKFDGMERAYRTD